MNENGSIPLNVNDDTNNASISFMDLNSDVRRIIFKNLDFVSRYNLSLIWKDMAEDFWRNVDVDKRWKRIDVTPKKWISKRKNWTSDNLADLEYAGVLASAGFITQVDLLTLLHVDVSSIPMNIINSLAKIVGIIGLRYVKGWRTSMLNDGKYVVLSIRDMYLDSVADKRPIKVLNDVRLDNLTGDLEGLVDSLAYGPVDQITRKTLFMKNMDFSKVPGPLLNSFFKTFRIEINLEKMTGISFQIMSGINCKSLVFRDIEFQEDPEGIGQNINLDVEDLFLDKVRGNLFSVFKNIKHCRNLQLEVRPSLLTNVNMTEVLKDKVECLHLDTPRMPGWLRQYDGDGICVRVEIPYDKDVEYYDYDYELDFIISWARKRGWTAEQNRKWIFSRPE